MVAEWRLKSRLTSMMLVGAVIVGVPAFPQGKPMSQNAPSLVIGHRVILRVSRSQWRLPPIELVSSRVRSVDSTAYCEHGRMANGRRTHDGAVAMNHVPFGSRYRVLNGPKKGKVLKVEDRIGSGSQFDIWVNSCRGAKYYGRRHIRIQRM